MSTHVLISMQKNCIIGKKLEKKIFLLDTTWPKWPTELMYTRSNGPIAWKLRTDGRLLFLALL